VNKQTVESKDMRDNGGLYTCWRISRCPEIVIYILYVVCLQCSNFEFDQAGMKEQLQQLYCLVSVTVPDLAPYLEKHDSSNMFFCFRWLLVLFKCEFSHHDIMRLWEVLWTDLPCPDFHLLLW
jgi:hypothetical protein